MQSGEPLLPSIDERTDQLNPEDPSLLSLPSSLSSLLRQFSSTPNTQYHISSTHVLIKQYTSFEMSGYQYDRTSNLGFFMSSQAGLRLEATLATDCIGLEKCLQCSTTSWSPSGPVKLTLDEISPVVMAIKAFSFLLWWRISNVGRLWWMSVAVRLVPYGSYLLLFCRTFALLFAAGQLSDVSLRSLYSTICGESSTMVTHTDHLPLVLDELFAICGVWYSYWVHIACWNKLLLSLNARPVWHIDMYILDNDVWESP